MNKRKKITVILIVIAVLVVTSAAGMVYMLKDRASKPSEVADNSRLSVGNNAYLNACNVFNESVYKKIMNTDPDPHRVKASYARQSTAEIYAHSSSGVISSCTRYVKEDHQISQIELRVQQFINAEEAKHRYDQVKKAKTAFGTVHDEQLENLGDAAYTSTANTLVSGALRGNAVFELTFGSLKSSDSDRPILIGGMRSVLASVDKNNGDGTFKKPTGAKVGDAPYVFPCDVFQTEDFKQAFNKDVATNEIESIFASSVGGPLASAAQFKTEGKCTLRQDTHRKDNREKSDETAIEALKSGTVVANVTVKQHRTAEAAKLAFDSLRDYAATSKAPEILSGIGEQAFFESTRSSLKHGTLVVLKKQFLVEVDYSNNGLDSKQEPVDTYKQRLQVIGKKAANRL